MTTIGESVSRLRNIIKASKQDAFITDRFLYSLVIKYAKLYMKRQDMLNVRLKFSSLFKALVVELKEVNKVEAQCGNLPPSCKIFRSVDKIPNLLQGPYGPFIRNAFSVDGSTEIYRTDPGHYTSLTKTSSFKYNKNKYFWYINGYLYFPNVEWPAVRIEAIFEKDFDVFACGGDSLKCENSQDTTLPIPDDLFAEVEKQVLQDLGFNMQTPSDTNVNDKQNIAR